MNVSIKKRIYWSFTLLVMLFVANGIVSIITLNDNMKLSHRLTTVIDPSLLAIEDFQDMLVESKMYSTGWVFLRSSQADKDALQKLHDTDYPKMKLRLTGLFSKLYDRSMADSLSKVFSGFEQVLAIEKKIISSLQKFEDYDDPVAKFESERMLEDEILPLTAKSMNTLGKIVSYEQTVRQQQNTVLKHSLMLLRTLISVLAITIICIGIFLSVYFARIIISPINKIRKIINDLGKGILLKVNYEEKKDEIGEMVNAVNNLSEKLQGTANFANEVGSRNFDVPFQPLGTEDVLGKALIKMRDNLKRNQIELREANTEIQTIYDASLDAVIIIDEVGKIVKWDHKAEILFGWKEDEVMGKSLTDNIIPVQYREAHEKGMRHFFRTGEGPVLSKTIEVSALRKDNTEFDISLSISPVLIKDRYRFIGFIRDITSRKKAEARLHRSEAALEMNNKELTQKNAELEQFAYVASHDLQEPVRTISGFAEMLRMQYEGKLDAKADKCLSFIIQSSDRMKVFINDLLQYSRIGNEKINKEVNCSFILADVLADLGKAIEETQAEIDVDPLPLISGYPTEIKQVFQNLVVNAIKFRKNDSVPKISISAQLKNGDWEFSFSDNGIGIEEQYNEKIFIIFQRLHTRNEYQGSGIGLSNCKKIIELHKGKIWVRSKPGEGSTFYFTIPQKTNL
ncbi:MAG: ATP-binding protein [Ferruginibacter sp.]